MNIYKNVIKYYFKTINFRKKIFIHNWLKLIINIKIYKLRYKYNENDCFTMNYVPDVSEIISSVKQKLLQMYLMKNDHYYNNRWFVWNITPFHCSQIFLHKL